MFLQLRFTHVYIHNEFFFVFGLSTTCSYVETPVSRWIVSHRKFHAIMSSK